MVRTDDDTWDINESVGATALGVAAGRAAEHNRDKPLIADPYAQLFLEAAGDGIWSLYLSDDLPVELAEVDPRFRERLDAMRDYIACRTLFFDEFFVAAAVDGVRQFVIVAAGLDARVWRLAWPTGSVVYEIDQPKVLEFKTATLDAHAVVPIARYVQVPIDLRHDWPAALRDAGFDPSVRTAWSAEGLLPYLTAEAETLLFDRVQGLSAPGSRIAVEAFTSDFFSAESVARREEQMQRYRDVAVTLGRDDVAQSGNLLYDEQRTDVVNGLRARGWDATAVSAAALMARNDRFIAADLDDATPQSVFVDALLR